MTENEAKEIAELLNTRNQLVRKYTAHDVMEKAENYEYESRDNRVVACVEREKLQWYQWEIRHLSVSPKCEGKGLASIVYKRAESTARAGGAAILQCTIRQGNERSEAFFTRHGFSKIGSFVYQLTGNTVGIWQKILRPVPE
ncbi:MAG: GNAT family N-acetyltransferase [Acidobacteriia bacterium]|nr:GNAT family N-acetyltransferase [Terriglobia bacterium]